MQSLLGHEWGKLLLKVMQPNEKLRATRVPKISVSGHLKRGLIYPMVQICMKNFTRKESIPNLVFTRGMINQFYLL